MVSQLLTKLLPVRLVNMCRAALEKLTVARLVKKIAAVYGTREVLCRV